MGGAPDFCVEHNLITYKSEVAESNHVLIEYENYSKVAPGHWRVNSYSIYEG
ncbi:hypothetical protein KR51_00006620 [Rubidibacter lacunae KORDI 51-2]|uniref:Uncharacterized protein n=1 Tax=Rubidibacter lacunae KORDI 51-2 TaxID=582515 RepID=U5DDP8_9CHRO|nr:hypothetical protein KR51_00006620 [Rubidibacter lacunae KORDI 51-2]